MENNDNTLTVVTTDKAQELQKVMDCYFNGFTIAHDMFKSINAMGYVVVEVKTNSLKISHHEDDDFYKGELIVKRGKTALVDILEDIIIQTVEEDWAWKLTSILLSLYNGEIQSPLVANVDHVSVFLPFLRDLKITEYTIYTCDDHGEKVSNTDFLLTYDVLGVTFKTIIKEAYNEDEIEQACHMIATLYSTMETIEDGQ